MAFDARNLLLDFSPLNRALAGYRQGVDDAYEGATARQAGALWQRGDHGGAAGLAFARGSPELGGRFAQIEQQRRAAEMDRERFGFERERFPVEMGLKRGQLEQQRAQLAQQREMQPLELELRRAQIKQAQQKDALTDYIIGQMRGSQDSGGAIQPQQQPPFPPSGGAPAPIRPGVQPQSFDGAAGDDFMIRTADGPAQRVPPPPAAYPPALAPGGVVQTPMGPMPIEQARRLGFLLAWQGKGDAGKMISEQADRYELGKEARNKIDEKSINAVNHVQRLNAIQSAYRPEYQQIPSRLKLWGAEMQARFGALPDQQKQELVGYARFRQAAADNMGRLLNELSGAAITQQEYERLRLTQPDAGTKWYEGDSPPTFEAKLQMARAEQMRALARYNILRQAGWTPQAISEAVRDERLAQMVPLESVDKIIDQKGREIEQQLRQRAPNMPPEQLRQLRNDELRRQLGIPI